MHAHLPQVRSQCGYESGTTPSGFRVALSPQLDAVSRLQTDEIPVRQHDVNAVLVYRGASLLTEPSHQSALWHGWSQLTFPRIMAAPLVERNCALYQVCLVQRVAVNPKRLEIGAHLKSLPMLLKSPVIRFSPEETKTHTFVPGLAAGGHIDTHGVTLFRPRGMLARRFRPLEHPNLWK